MNYVKYPRTEHLLGSKYLNFNEVDLNFKNKEQIDFPMLLPDEKFIIEEKMDGIGLGICFINSIPHIQQRGHLFSIDKTPDLLKNFKEYILHNEELLYCIIGEQFTIFGEWLEFKHTVFYNNLPSFFLEYDIFDHHSQYFLSTSRRINMINNSLTSVKVLAETQSCNLNTISELFNNNPTSSFCNNHWQSDFNLLKKNNPELQLNTLLSSQYEGFYIKIENQNEVTQRFKWITKDFFNIVSQNNHWKNQQLILNTLQNKEKFNYKI